MNKRNEIFVYIADYNDQLTLKGLTGNRAIPIQNIFKNYNTNKITFSELEEINQILQQLKNDNYLIKLDKEKLGDKYTNFTINYDKVNEIYALLKREPASEKLKKCNAILDNYKSKNKILDTIIIDKQNKLNNYAKSKGSILSEFNNTEKLDNIFKSLLYLLNNKIPIKYREFSQQMYNDSKAFEKIYEKPLKTIIETYLPELYLDSENNDDIDNIFSEFYLFKNPVDIKFKGKIRIFTNNDCLDISCFKNGISISSEDIDKIEKIEITGRALYTIENKTSYYSFQEENSAILYLAGFHNHTKTELLKKIYFWNPNIKYFHFGDIDAGGFYIYYHLLKTTDIPFEMFNMGIEQLELYKNNTKSNISKKISI